MSGLLVEGGAALRELLRDPARILLIIGSVLLVASFFLPWWSLRSNLVNGQVAGFEFTIGPGGMGVRTPVGDPRGLFAPLQFAFWAVSLVLLPISVSLSLGAFHGIYCAARGRRGTRVLIAPMWATIGLIWWTLYFLFVYSFFSAIGLDIPPTGTADLTWQGYELGAASWGWDFGLGIAVAGTVVLFAGAGVARQIQVVPGETVAQLEFGLHSAGLLVLAFFNLVPLVVAVLFRDLRMAILIFAVVGLLLSMAVFARVRKAPVGVHPSPTGTRRV